MKLAYFTNQYPKVSHSFIRREILALEKLGYEIERFALWSDEAELVDPFDKSEFKRRQAPPGIKVSEKAFGMGRRYPMNNHYRYEK